jgi:glutaminyl-tRNA synthetase
VRNTSTSLSLSLLLPDLTRKKTLPSHSLCTTEFVTARQSYDWLCNALEVYRPQQSEYGRLALQGTVMSKRKILKLVQGGYVSGWDDPRLYTLIALRRRGVPPGAIVSFVNQLGVTTANSLISIQRFEQSIRQHVELSTPRLMLIVHPVKVVIENLPEDYYEVLDKPLHPKVPSMGSVQVPFTRTVYVEESDFRTEDAKDYFRLAPGKTVGLLGAPRPVTCTSFSTDEATGKVTEIRCRYENEGPPIKPKGWIHWVAEHAPSSSPVRVDETRIFKPLFKSDDPAALGDEYLNDLDPDSLEVVKGSMIDVGFWEVARRTFAEAREEARKRTEEAAREVVDAQTGGRGDSEGTPVRSADQLVGNEVVRFQAVRTAYFALDSDSRLPGITDGSSSTAGAGAGAGDADGERIVLNWIVSLKEDAGKKTGGDEAGKGKKGGAPPAGKNPKKATKKEPSKKKLAAAAEKAKEAAKEAVAGVVGEKAPAQGEAAGKDEEGAEKTATTTTTDNKA